MKTKSDKKTIAPHIAKLSQKIWTENKFSWKQVSMIASTYSAKK